MKAAPASMGAVLAAPWRWQLNQLQPLMLWGGVLLLALLLGLLAAFKGWVVGLFAAGVAAVSLVVAAWMLTLSGLRRQNHPHLARLVPGHVRRLRLAVLLLWGLPVLAVGAGARWLASDPWAALLLTALVLSVLTTFLRWPMSFVLVWFLPPTLIPLWQRWPLTRDLTEAWQSAWHLGPQWLCLPILGALAWFQMDLIGRGDEAHAQRYRRLERLLASLHQGGNPRYQGRWGLRMGWLFAALQRWYMARLSALPRPTLRHRLARLELPLYGSAHWTMVLGSLLVVLPVIALAVGLAGLLGLLGPELPAAGAFWHELPGGWLLLGAGQLFMGLLMGTMFSMSAALQRSRREQALLVLLPGVPQQGQLRAGLLTRQGWLLLGLALPGLLLLSQVELPGPAPLLLGFGVGLLPASLLLLRPWAEQSRAGQLHLLLAVPVGLFWHFQVHDALDARARLLLVALLLLLTVLAWIAGLRRLRGETLAPLPMGRRAA